MELCRSAQHTGAMLSWGDWKMLGSKKKGGMPNGMPPNFCVVGGLKRLLQCVDAGAEVNVKGGAIHY
jgi:hypothetical protein